MRFLSKMRAGTFLAIGVLQLVVTSPAQAAGFILLNTDMLAIVHVLQLAGSQKQCFMYSYDLNGNRLANNSLAYSTTAAWGSTVYGCFDWTAS